MGWGRCLKTNSGPRTPPGDSTHVRIGCSWEGVVGPLRRSRNIIDQSRLNLEQVMSSTAVRTQLNGCFAPSRKTLGNFLVDTGPGPTELKTAGLVISSFRDRRPRSSPAGRTTHAWGLGDGTCSRVCPGIPHPTRMREAMDPNPRCIPALITPASLPDRPHRSCAALVRIRKTPHARRPELVRPTSLILGYGQSGVGTRVILWIVPSLNFDDLAKANAEIC